MTPLALLSLDRELFRTIHVGLHRDWLDQWVLWLTYTGDGLCHATVILAMIVWKKTRPYGWACLAAFLFSGAVQAVIKELTQRVRPSNFDFARPLEEIYGNTSFPSGHTTTSFAIAFMIAWMVKDTKYANWGWGLSAWALMVGLSRVYVGIHYPGDVLGGIAVAAVCTSTLFLIWQKKGWIPESQPGDAESESGAIEPAFKG